MAAVLPIPPSVNMMEDNPAWIVILADFGLAVRSIDRLTEDYSTANDLMASNVEQIKSVVYHQNKIYRSHSTVNQRCYINTAQLNRILVFYHWTIYAVKEGKAGYDDKSAATFDLDWINSIVDEYLMMDPSMTPSVR